MDAHGTRADRAHSPAGHPSDQSRHRLRLRARPRLRAAAGTRRLPHHGRRRELGARPLRGRGHGMLRHRPRPGQPAQPVRRDLAAGDPHLRAHQRRTRRRAARFPRRRRHLGEAEWSRQRHRAAEPAGGEGRGGGCPVESRPRLRHARDRRRDPVGRPRDRGWPGLGLDRRRPHLGARHPQPQRHGPAALLLAGRGLARRRERGVLPDRLLLRVHRRRPRHRRDPARGRPGRRPPRHVDRPRQRRPHDRRPRPGPLHLHQPRQDLVSPASHQRADVPRDRGQRDPLQRPRQQAGRAHLPRAQQQPHPGPAAHRRHSARHVAPRGRRRERIRHPRSG